MLLQLGHGTVIDVEGSEAILLVHGDKCVPLSLRMPNGTKTTQRTSEPKAERQRKFKKVRYAGAER